LSSNFTVNCSPLQWNLSGTLFLWRLLKRWRCSTDMIFNLSGRINPHSFLFIPNNDWVSVSASTAEAWTILTTLPNYPKLSFCSVLIILKLSAPFFCFPSLYLLTFYRFALITIGTHRGKNTKKYLNWISNAALCTKCKLFLIACLPYCSSAPVGWLVVSPSVLFARTYSTRWTSSSGNWTEYDFVSVFFMKYFIRINPRIVSSFKAPWWAVLVSNMMTNDNMDHSVSLEISSHADCSPRWFTGVQPVQATRVQVSGQRKENRADQRLIYFFSFAYILWDEDITSPDITSPRWVDVTSPP
jgi:hypothetical protein